MLKFVISLMFMVFLSKLKNQTLFLMMMIFFFFFFYNFHFFYGLGYLLSSDSISGHLVMLSFIVVLLMYMSSNKIWENNENSSEYFVLLIIMMVLLCLIFFSMNLFMFFLWFELILIPMFMLVLGWGFQQERFSAGMYLVFYTLFGSLPLVLGLIYLQSGDNLLMMSMVSDNVKNMKMWTLVLFGAFLMKLPMYLLHYWLPKAHVEAPVAGSMMLAGVLLKLGGYGLFRVYGVIGKGFLNNYLMSISLIGGVFTSLVCLRSIDVKSLVAYSSIGHMGLMLSGLMTGNLLGFQGGVLMMIGHGMCSSGMFCMMNIIYERVGSRSIILMKGMLSISPSMSFWLFLLLSSNMSAPPSLNLLSEVSLMASIYNYCLLNGIILFMQFMLSCAYSLYLYSFISHGICWKNFNMKTMNIREMLLIFFHWFPLNMYFLKISSF